MSLLTEEIARFRLTEASVPILQSHHRTPDGFKGSVHGQLATYHDGFKHHFGSIHQMEKDAADNWLVHLGSLENDDQGQPKWKIVVPADRVQVHD